MKVFEGPQEVPVIYTAHHASHDFGEFADRVALTSEEQFRFSDYGSDATVPLNGIATIVAGHSRALGDLNRDPDDPARFQIMDYGRPAKHEIWKFGEELSASEKIDCDKKLYEPFHEAILTELRKSSGLRFVVAWDNTASYAIGENTAGETVMMPDFVLSNRGSEDSPEAGPDEPTSCDPEFLEMLSSHFSKELEAAGLPSRVHMNVVFKGGYICRRYSTLRNKQSLQANGISSPVQSLQLEYNTAITHDQQTLQPIAGTSDRLRHAFSAAIQSTVHNFI